MVAALRQRAPGISAEVLRAARLHDLPRGDRMIPQDAAHRLHRAVRETAPDLAAEICAEAGRLTGSYILAHRIPWLARQIVRQLPAGPAARLLSGAIARHAWTFAGSGSFRVVSPWEFELRANPLVAGERSAHPLCHWHAGVFGELYRSLVHPGCVCAELSCTAQGDGPCTFSLSRR